MEDFQNLKKTLKKHTKKVRKYHQKLLKRARHTTLVVLLIGFFLIFATLSVLQHDFSKQIQKIKTNTLPFSVLNASYPIITKRELIMPLTAQSAIMMDDDSKVILYSKNATVSFPMASTTKIMTALIAMDYYHPDDVLVIKNEHIEGVRVGFRVGEKVKFEDLLYALLLPSGNDVAKAFAQNYPNGESAFVSHMNKKAQEYRLSNTHFQDPIGLSQENRTTALDLARLSSIAIKNPEFARIVSTKEKRITTEDGNSYILTNLNKLLGGNGINGIKTGFTDEAGQVLVTSSLRNNHTIIMVVMKSQDRFADTQDLLSFISSHLTFLSIHP